MAKPDPINEATDRIVAALLDRARRRASEPTNLDLFEAITKRLLAMPPADRGAALDVLHRHQSAALAEIEAMMPRPRKRSKRGKS